MAGRNYIPPSALNLRSDHRPTDDLPAVRPHRRLTTTELRLIEDRIAAQHREIQTLLLDNQRLATSHVALKQEVIASQQDLRHLAATSATVKAERDAQVREVYERSVKLQAEVRPIEVLTTELDRVQSEIKELRLEREQLTVKLKETEDEMARIRPALQEFSDLKTDIEAMQKEIRKGRAAVEYEKKMHSTNFEISEVMEKHLISMAREAEKLRSELANADKRAMAAVLGAGAGAPANPGIILGAGAPANQGVVFGAGAVANPGAVFGAGAPPNSGTVFNAGAPANTGAIYGAGAPPNPGTVFDAGAPANTGAVYGAGAPPNPGAVFGAGAVANPGAIYGAGAPANSAAVFGAGVAANSGPGYAIHPIALEPGFGGNTLPDHNAVQQGTFSASMNYVYGGGPVIPHGQYDIPR